MSDASSGKRIMTARDRLSAVVGDVMADEFTHLAESSPRDVQSVAQLMAEAYQRGIDDTLAYQSDHTSHHIVTTSTGGDVYVSPGSVIIN